VPRNFYFIEKPTSDPKKVEQLFIETDREQAKDAKEPYKEIFLKGDIESKFIFRTALSKHVLPFALLDPSYIVLPVLKEHGKYVLKTSGELRKSGFRAAADWFSQAEKEWNEKRGQKAGKVNIYDWLNYQNKLIKQDPISDHLVLYNTSGMNVSATMAEIKSFGQPFFADAKTYWCSPRSREEGYYITAILNSDIINRLIKPFQSKGLLGERDIHTKVLEAPIPEFKKSNKLHKEIAELAEEAEKQVRGYVSSHSLPKSIGRQRGEVRQSIKELLGQIDKKVERLIGL
jgi:hypothetical protein